MASVVPQLPARVQETLDAFRADGIELTHAEVAWLVEIRKSCDRPSDGSIPWVMGAPVKYGGEVFWPLHELADSWWTRAHKLVEFDSLGKVACFLFAHTRSAPGDTSLRMLTGTEEIREAVLSWYEQSAIHRGQILEIQQRLMRLDGIEDSVEDPDAKPREQTDTATRSSTRFVSAMCKAYPGVTPEYWLTEISASDAHRMMEDACSDGVFATSPERTKAITSYLRAVKTLWRNHRG